MVLLNHMSNREELTMIQWMTSDTSWYIMNKDLKVVGLVYDFTPVTLSELSEIEIPEYVLEAKEIKESLKAVRDKIILEQGL